LLAASFATYPGVDSETGRLGDAPCLV